MTIPDFVYNSKLTSRPDTLYRPSPADVFRRRAASLGIDINKALNTHCIETADFISFLKGEKDVDLNLANQLELLTNISVKSWLYFQEKYDLSLK